MTAVLAEPPLSMDVSESITGSPLTRFIGRDAEVATLLAQVRGTRLLSLVGPGGSGKTRLARAVLDRLAGTDAQRSWWVPLAHLDRPALIVAAVADALGVTEVPGRCLRAAVLAYLSEHDGLLVLDNCEHLVEACASLVGDLLRACPSLRVMTTSREPLAVAAETTWWVRGLSVPTDRPVPTAADLAGSQAVQLFTDRARLVRGDFAVTDHNAVDVARLCRRLDGMPLALELAAARLRVLPLPRIVGYLDDAVSLLVTTNRDVPPRQATLRATLDWSHDLLPGPERDLFARLSVFRGEFDLPGVEAVVGGGFRTLEILDLLNRLVDKSLVQASTEGIEERYRLLEVVRQYASDQLGDGRPAAMARHAAYMADLAEQAEHHLGGSEQRHWLDRLGRDRNNLRAALSWTRDNDATLGIRLAGALGRYWRLSGQYGEGRQWLDGAVSAADDTAAPVARAKALTALGTLEFLQCEYAAAAARLARARDLYVAVGDDHGVASALQNLGSIAREQGRYAEAWEHHEQALTMWRRLADPAGIARALRSMGFTAWLEGDHERAVGLSTDALHRFRTLGYDEGVAGALVDLGAATYRRGDPDSAEKLLREGLAVAEKLGLREAVAWATEQLGLIAGARGDRTEAVTHLRGSITIHHELGDRWRTGSVLDALAGLSTDARTGARLLAAAERLRQQIGTPLPPCDVADHDLRVRAVAAALSRSDLTRATAEGSAMSVEQAVTEAVADEAVAGVRAPAPPRAVATAVATPPDLSVNALGRSRVRVGGRTLGPEDWTYAKPRELLYHLLSRPGSTKAEIGLALWPEASGTELRNSFHTCLKFLRRAVGDAARVRYAGGAYHLDAGQRLRYDVDDFRHAATAARRHGGTATAIGPLVDAAGRYPGDFLGDVPVGAWADPYRAELRREYEHVLRSLGSLLARERRFEEAADVFARLIDHDPLLEAAHRALMRCHAALGDRRRALHQYDRLVQLLDTQVGAPPAPETTELYTRLRGPHPGA